MIDLTHIHIGWPQWLILVWAIIRVVAGAIRDGKETKYEVKFGLVLISTLVLLVILSFGGFFGAI